MNKKLVIGLVAVVIVVAGFAAVFGLHKNASAPANQEAASSQAADETDSSEQTEATSSNDQTSSQTATITFTDDGFMPSTLTVKKGTVVTVKNSSSNRVQFSSDDHPTHRLDPEINLEVLEPGESASFTAKTVGTHGFHDHIDDSKVGTLIVTE